MRPQGFEDDTTFDAWEKIGQGSQGEIWRARRIHDDHPVIVKITGSDPDDVNRRLQAHFRSEGLNDRAELQRFHMVMRTTDNVALIFDYVEGATLSDTLKRKGSLPIDDVRRIGERLLNGLAALHAAHLIHRDVTPDNIVLGDEGAVLIDYGAMGELKQRSRFAQTTVGGDFAGKFLYAAPEQVSGAPQSSAVDIWALGAVLYEAATGQRLRTETTPMEILQGALKMPDLSAAPEALQPTLSAMLAVDPAQRPEAETAARLLSGEDGAGFIPGEFDELLKQNFGVKRSPSLRDAVISPALNPLADTASTGPGRDRDTFGLDDPVPPARPPTPPPPSRGPVPMSAIPPSEGRPRSAVPSLLWLLLVPVLALAGAGIYLSGTFLGPSPVNVPLLPLALIAGGLVLALGGFVLWKQARPKPSDEPGKTPLWASALMDAPDARDLLTRTILVNIEALYARTQAPGGGLLAVQMAALAKEYSDAETSSQRIEALRMLNDLHMHAAETPSRFWRGWDGAAGRVASLASLLAGLVALAEGARRLF